LRIATWNIERLRNKNRLPRITANCENANADVLVLTETDSRIKLKYKSLYSTLSPDEKDYYNPTETRVTIYTNNEFIRHHATFDERKSVCVELKTEIGNLIVYGTIIGIYGNRHKSFMDDLLCQVKDIERLAKENNVCVIGDFNCSFSDNYYFTKDGRAALEDVLLKNNITLITRTQPECIDHIAISDGFINGMSTKVDEWNINKKLSDHKGIWVDLT